MLTVPRGVVSQHSSMAFSSLSLNIFTEDRLIFFNFNFSVDDVICIGRTTLDEFGIASVGFWSLNNATKMSLDLSLLCPLTLDYIVLFGLRIQHGLHFFA